MSIIVKSGIVVWVDVDEVLLDFRRMFNRFLKENYSLNIDEDYIPFHWHYDEFFEKEEDFLKAFNSIPKDWPLNLKKLSNADKFTHRLRELGCRVVLITHIPEEKAPDRILNLVKNNIHFDEVYFTFGREKGEYARNLIKRYKAKDGSRIKSLYIDDRAHNLVNFFENIPELDFAVTLDLPYNKDSIKKIKDKFKNRVNFKSKTHFEMFDLILKKISFFLKKRKKKIKKIKK